MNTASAPQWSSQRGFREIGRQGLKLEQAATENARRYGLRFMGPNCLGLIRPATGLNCTFNKGGADQGKLPWCPSPVRSAQPYWTGRRPTIADIDYLVSDPETKSILLGSPALR